MGHVYTRLVNLFFQLTTPARVPQFVSNLSNRFGRPDQLGESIFVNFHVLL